MLLLMPFCPLMLISSPSGPCTIVTPGVSCMKLRKFRPLLGRPLRDALSMSVESSALVVSMIGDGAVTSTSCCTADTFRVTGRLTVWPTASVRPSCT
jgi:hypothetical protein